MSVSFTSEDFNAECNFSNRNFSDLMKLLNMDSEEYCGEISPTFLLIAIQKCKDVTSAIRDTIHSPSQTYASFQKGNVSFQSTASVIDCGSNKEQIIERINRLKKVVIYCIENNQNVSWG